MRRYQQVLAVGIVLLFFSSVDLYLFVADLTAVTPKDWVLLFGALMSPLVIHRLYHQGLPNRQFGNIALWSAAYLAISVVWYLFSPSDVAVQELRDRALAVSFMCMTGFVFSTPESRKAAACAAIGIVVATVIINGIELVEPEWFVMDVITRSSGLYVNANQCGAALVIGMIIGYPLIPRRMRLSFCLMVGGGVAMTFSRGASVGWLLTSGILLASDSTRVRAREATVGGLIAFVLIAALVQGVRMTGMLDGLVLDDNQSDRVSFFKTFDTSDAAANERMDVASKGWGMFVASPVVGNGLGSTMQWSERSSTHNMYLYFMVDHGLLGLLILPAMVFFVFQGRGKGSEAAHWAFCIFTLGYAFFSHNVLTERYQLLAFGYFAMGATAEVPLARRLRQAARSLSPRPAVTAPPALAELS